MFGVPLAGLFFIGETVKKTAVVSSACGGGSAFSETTFLQEGKH